METVTESLYQQSKERDRERGKYQRNVYCKFSVILNASRNSIRLTHLIGIVMYFRCGISQLTFAVRRKISIVR